MPRGPADQPKTPGQVNVYWRRRGIALAAGIGMPTLALSLSPPGYTSRVHPGPRFSVVVVPPAPARCPAALGAARLHIVITAGGKHQVWDSADCGGPAARVTTLARGVPAAVQISW